MKKILIMTHGLGHNYGGIAQAFALQEFLRRNGYHPETSASEGSFYIKYIARNDFIRRALKKPELNSNDLIARNTQVFIDENITTVSFQNAKQGARLGEYLAYIAGSDQVWRRYYVHVPDYLFGFIRNKNAYKFSYSASFGVDSMEEYNPLEIRRTGFLAKKFKAISVREKSGISLAEKHWGVTAQQHIDPTLLLGSLDYKNIITNSSFPEEDRIPGGIFQYVLDTSERSKKVIEAAKKHLNLDSHEIIQGDLNAGTTLPPIENWFQRFRDSDFIITDSFHGTVFSIIFNKPFISITNPGRGTARFKSLLEIFGLEERLITDPTELTPALFAQNINWEQVNSKVRSEQDRAKKFLLSQLETAQR